MVVTFSQLGQKGRLGNCLFQAAATIALSLRNGDNYQFPHCEIERLFHIPQDRFIARDKIKYRHVYNEPYFHYREIRYKRDIDLNGYFQSIRYFNNCKDKIRLLFTPRVKVGGGEGRIGIHIRRGDYLEKHLQGCFENLGLEYYMGAIKIFGDERYIIFSDDIGWCKKVFIGKQYTYSEGRLPIEDLSLMIGCKGHIIANSSFSWWGAWLSGSDRVIAPERWFGPKLRITHDTRDLIPREWQRI